MSVQSVCEAAGLSSYLGATAQGTYVEKDASAFDQQGIDNRVNTSWKRAEHIIIRNPDGTSIASLLPLWKRLAGGDDAKRQRLYYPVANDLYEMYDAEGNIIATDSLDKLITPKVISYRGDNAYLAAIRTKPFILLAGISGTGKSRMVRQLARGCCPRYKAGSTTEDHPLYNEQKPGNYEIIPVRPNWHDSTELIGYVTRITADDQPKFVLTPFVKFLAKAWQNLDVPFFLCLDEMNLAPVEQYFAEYLSAIETRDWFDETDHAKGMSTDVMVRFDVAQINDATGIDPTVNFVQKTVKELLPGYEAAVAGSDLKKLGDKFVEDCGIRIPPNLVVMGTVNMDETTCSFSRKVLDRAMTFELNDVSDMYDPAKIAGEGPYEFGSIDVNAVSHTLLNGNDACADDAVKSKAVLDYIKTINDVLENTPFKIAYRSRNEMLVYCLERTRGALVDLPHALDEATSMKILSRIEGDEQKLTYVGADGQETDKTLLDILKEKISEALKVANGGNEPTPPCEVCSKKLEFMSRRIRGGFTNFFV